MVNRQGTASSSPNAAELRTGPRSPPSTRKRSGPLRRQRSSERSSDALKRYASTRKYGRRHELQREDEHVHNTKTVVYSKRNPDEEDTVMAAQWRIAEALAREKSLFRLVAAFINRTLGTATSKDPTVVLNHVLLGNQENAEDSRLLYLLGITHICNCAKQVANSFEGEFVYLKLNLHDSQDEELIPHFQAVTNFIKRVERLRGRVLIHCISGEWRVGVDVDVKVSLTNRLPSTGASRSPALVIAYLMIDKKMPLLDAYNMVRRRRHVVQPNQAFRLQLAKYELMLFGASSVATTPDKDWNFYAWNEVKNDRRLR